MGYYIKKTEQTAPVQAVTESSLKSASEVNVPTVKAVLNGLHYPNLLVNGDFQINQRGQDEYTKSSGYLYTLDMWCVYVNSASENVKVLKTGNGIKLTSSSKNRALCQKFEPLEVGKKYILIVKINNTIRKLEFVGGTYITNNQYLSYEISGNFEYITIKQDGVDIEVEYADLFEGDIAYPHVKEDYAIALMRCMAYLQVCYPYSYLRKFWSNGKADTLVCSYPLKADVKKNPTITGYSNAWIYSNDSATDYKDSFNYTVEVNNGKLEIKFIKKDNSKFTESNYSMAYTGKFIISCEPL